MNTQQQTRRQRNRSGLIAFCCWAFLLASSLSCFGASNVHETIEQVLPRVVKIYGAGGYANLYAYCSGFVVTPQGHIVTAWTHVLDADKVKVVLHDGRRFSATVMAAEPSLDVAVLELETDDQLDLPYFDLSQSRPTAPGTTVLGFSNMFKVATGNEPVSVIHGAIAARTRLDARRGASDVQYKGEVYVVDAVTNNSGAAGGIVTTREGMPVGMIGKEVQDRGSSLWINYCIPIDQIREVVGQIISGDFSRKDSIDETNEPARYVPLDFGLVMVPDVVFRTPAYIEKVLKNSPSMEQKLQTNDLVLFVNSTLVHSLREFRTQLGQLEPGDELTLIVRRGSQLVTVRMPVPKETN